MRRSAIVLLFIPACVSAQDFGPIRTRNYRSLSLPYFRFVPRVSVIGPSQSRWELDTALANDFRLWTSGSREVEEDQETLRAVLVFRRGVRGGEFLVELPLISRGGGVLDPLVNWWHLNILRWGSNLRDQTRNGRSVVRVPGRSFGNATGVGDMSVAFSRQAGKGLILSSGLKFPSGNSGELLGSGGFDFGIGAIVTRSLGKRWYGAAQLGLVAQSKGSALPKVRPWVHQEGLFLWYEQSAKDAWNLQWQSEASSTRTGVPLSDSTHRLVTFGYQRRLSSGKVLQLYFSEDRDLFEGKLPELANVGPDFTIGANLGFRF